ncbi:MAG: heme exporter protein CcmB [Planctomycetes bacterium]|nr:heme exporter protein CcmB [Planctomycetota bacterium]
MNALRDIALLVAKDLRVEARGRYTLPLLCVLGILFVTVLGLGLASRGDGVGPNAGAVLWVAYLFGGALCFEKTMAVDHRDDALAALLMTPIDRGVLFVSKWIANVLLLSVVAAVVTAASLLFLGLKVNASPSVFIRVTVLGLAGFAAVGTLFSGVVATTRMHGGLLAAVVFPLCLPLVLASARLLNDPQSIGVFGLGESVLVAFDLVFLAVGWLTFDLLLEA